MVELASCYIDDQLKLQPKQRRFIDYKSDFESSSSSASWRNPIISSSFDEYISAREAYDMLNTLLRDGVNYYVNNFRFLLLIAFLRQKKTERR